jgi:uncharacterized heparinase superfamily protein
MSLPSVRHSVSQIQAMRVKGPRHLLNLGHFYAARAIQQVGRVWSPPAVNELAFLTQITLAPAQRATHRGDLAIAKKTVLEHFRTRTQPVFCFDPLHIPALAASVENTARERTIAQANQVCRHVFHLRGEPPVTFDGSVNWLHCPQGNLDWTWELNRHAYFAILGRAYAYTGDERYAHEFRHLLLDWLAHNPVGVNKPNWSSPLEVAYRINVWLWAYYYFIADPAFDDAALLGCLRGLWIHGRYLAANLEYHAPNNHLLLESKALAMCGLLLPEFRDARAWLDHGLAILWQQVRQQVRPDGVHREQATMYHQIITSELLEILVLLEDNGIAAPPDITAAFTHMLNFERAMTKPDGQIPLIGDSALGDSYVRFTALSGGAALLNRMDLAPAPLDEATLWLVGPERADRLRSVLPGDMTHTSQAFPDGGYFVMRHGQDPNAAYLIFDCGPFGYPPAPGHGHADALSFELFASGRTLIADPGVYSYHLGAEWRNYFRSTAAHNTITVDGLDQSQLLGLWHVIRPAQATLHKWVTAQSFDFVDGSHDGYTHLRQPITHRRQIFFVKPEYWIILDLLDGQGEHRFDLYFHLMPDANVSVDASSGAAQVRYCDSTDLVISPVQNGELATTVITGSLDPIQGWISQYSGQKNPAPTLRYTKLGPAPTLFGAILYPCTQSHQAFVNVSPLVVTDEKNRTLDARAATGLKIQIGQWLDYFVADHRKHPGRKSFAGYMTDGQLAYVRQRSAGHIPVKAILHDGNELRLGKAALNVSADGRVVTEMAALLPPSTT